MIQGIVDEWSETDEGHQAIYYTDPGAIPIVHLPRVVYELRLDVQRLNDEVIELHNRSKETPVSTLTSDIRDAVFAVVAKHAKERLQPVYKSLLDDLGISSGDISPMESLVLENAEATWSATTASWLVNSLSFDHRTLRT